VGGKEKVFIRVKSGALRDLFPQGRQDDPVGARTLIAIYRNKERKRGKGRTLLKDGEREDWPPGSRTDCVLGTVKDRTDRTPR